MRSKPRPQAEFDFPNNWGGRRAGAGRKPVGERAGVSHRARVDVAKSYPLLVTARLLEGLPSLRTQRAYPVVFDALRDGAEQFGARVVHWSVQTNHLHLIVEGRDRRAVSRCLQGLFIRLAKRLNRLWERKGSVFADHYRDRVLRSPTEVRFALVYVLHNCKKHGERPRSGVDPFSTGLWFDGWRDPLPAVDVPRPSPRPRTWLLRRGWRKRGRIGVREGPAP